MKLLLLAVFLPLCSSVQLPYLSGNDHHSLVKVFESSLSKPKDVQSLFYGISGLKLLGEKVPDEANYCEYVKTNVKLDNIESVYSAVDIARRLQNCKLDNTVVMEDTLKNAITEQQTTQNLYYAISALKFINAKVDNAKFLQSLTVASKRDDSVQSISYALHAASRASGDLKPFIDRIEDVVAQADEVDGSYLQFEGGLSITANAVSGIYSLGDKVNRTAPMKAFEGGLSITANAVSGIYSLGDKVNRTAPMKAAEALKFSNYLLSRKSVQLARPAYHLVRALQFINKNKHQVPVSITLDSNLSVHPGNDHVTVKVSDVFGKALPGITSVAAVSAMHDQTQGVVMSKAAMESRGDGLYSLRFYADDREEGFYTIKVEAQSSDKRYIGLTAQVKVKVLADVAIHSVEVSVTDRDQTGTSNPINVQHPNKISTTIDADYHQKLLMKFNLKNKKLQTPMTVQQAFVLFRNVDTKQEIIFVAEPDRTGNEKTYKFDVDLLKSASDFDNLSGKYSMVLLIGDAVLSNSFQWNVADLNLQFPIVDRPVSTKASQYQPKKTIKHLFREPEKRPSRFISNLFTALVIVPFFLMLILWLVVGANVSNFLFSIYTLAFHVGLAAIFGLYLMFFLELNMFQTVRWLAVIGIFTFLAGNAMLKRMAERRMEKKKTQ